VYPAPGRRADEFLAALESHLERHRYAAVFPVEDHTTLLVARHTAQLEATGTAVATEDWPTFERGYDKAELFDAVASLDVPSPETHAPTSMAEVGDLADTIQYPAVIKPRSESHFRDGECLTTLVTGES
jgi:carbamoylphosphate synthase large subunit